MKNHLYTIFWTTDEGREITDHIAAPEMDINKATAYVIELYTDLWGYEPGEFTAEEINSLDYYTMDTIDDINGISQTVSLSPATFDSAKAWDYLLAMQGFLKNGEVKTATQYAEMVQELLEDNVKKIEAEQAHA
jgi:hypothetical protein